MSGIRPPAFGQLRTSTGSTCHFARFARAAGAFVFDVINWYQCRHSHRLWKGAGLRAWQDGHLSARGQAQRYDSLVMQPASDFARSIAG